MNKIIALTTGVMISVVAWVSVAMLYTQHMEPWDNETVFYLSMFFQIVAAFGIALRKRFVFALLFLLGLLAGNMLYPAFFGSADQKLMWPVGLMMALSMLVYPLIAAVVGWLLRRIWLMFFATRFKHLEETLKTKVDTTLEKPPKWAYRPFLFTQSAKNVAIKQLLLALLFGMLGVLAIIYPSPPLEPLPTFVHKLVTITGYLFLGGFFWYGYRALRLFFGKGGWHVSLDEEKLIYHTPAGSTEPSFECRLDEMDKVEVIVDNDPDSGAPPIFYLYTKWGHRYEFGYNESSFSPGKLVWVLRARGIEVVNTYDS